MRLKFNILETKQKIAKIKVLYFILGGFLIFNIVLLFCHYKQPKDNDEELLKKFHDAYKIFSFPLPKKLNFAGEPVPMQYFDVREALDREFLINTYWQSQMIMFVKRAQRSFRVIEPILKSYGIPDDFKYLAITESGLVNQVSPMKAVGVWQILEETGKQYGLEINDEVDERYHLVKSTEAACKYFREAYQKYNNWTLAAASYNVGMNGIEKQMIRQKQNSFYDLLLNEETTRYVYKTLAIKTILESPQKYGFYVRKFDVYASIPAHSIKVDSTITDLVNFAAENKTSYKILKYLNPWLRDNFLKNKHKKTYTIEIADEGARVLDYVEYELSLDSGNVILDKVEMKPFSGDSTLILPNDSIKVQK